MELPLSRLDLNLLNVFDMLMQERNVTRAAERLHLSQSTVSHALGRLRQALDDPLFVMSRREMMPTERAKALAGPVRQALAMLEQGLRQAKGFDPASAQRVDRWHKGGWWQMRPGQPYTHWRPLPAGPGGGA